MTIPIKILYVEDDPRDAELVLYELKKCGYEPIVTRVQTKEEFLEHLLPTLDIILADYALPQFTGLDALVLLKERFPDIPLIIITGVLGDEKAAEAMKLGAVDYLLKDRLARLGGSVNHAMKERDLKRTAIRLDHEIRESEQKFREIFNNVNDSIEIHEVQENGLPGKYLEVNDIACQMLRFSREELLTLDPLDIATGNYNRPIEEIGKDLQILGYSRFETEHKRKDGTIVPVEINAHVITLLGRKVTLSVVRDISERKKHEQALRIANQKLNLMNIVAWHDVYNKITGLRGYVELSKEHITNKKAQDFLAREEEVLEMIQQQIAYTKEYQKIGEKPPRWQKFGSILKDLFIAEVSGSIHVTNDAENLELYADPVIEKVFWHLIDNSKKHGGNVTEIRFSARESAYGCTLVYEDNGVGIPEDKRESLFTKSFGKMTGFDLFFVHDILDIYGMNIDETGEPGKGARFEIKIPKGIYGFTNP
jgi:PAS domain S-box-containing protein